MTSRPAFMRFGTTKGTSATRRSPGYSSLGTPTITRLVSFPYCKGNRSISSLHTTTDVAYLPLVLAARQFTPREEFGEMADGIRGCEENSLEKREQSGCARRSNVSRGNVCLRR